MAKNKDPRKSGKKNELNKAKPDPGANPGVDPSIVKVLEDGGLDPKDFPGLVSIAQARAAVDHAIAGKYRAKTEKDGNAFTIEHHGHGQVSVSVHDKKGNLLATHTGSHLPDVLDVIDTKLDA